MSALGNLFKRKGTIQPPKPRPVYETRTLAVVGLPPGASVQLHTAANVWQGQSADQSGMASWDGVSAYLSDSDVRVTAPGFAPYEEHITWRHIPRDGDGTLPLNQQVTIGVELPALRPLQPVSTARSGLVRAIGKELVDDDGAFRPLGATLFWAVNGMQHEPERCKHNIDWFADHDVDYLAILAQAGWIDPDSPGYENALGLVIDYAYSRRMRTEIRVIGGGARDPMDVAAKVARVINAGRAHKVIYGLAANESYNGNLSATECIAVTKYMRAHTPNLWAVSDPRPGDADDLKRIILDTHAAGGNLYAFEPDRSPRDLDWGMVRQTYDVKEFPGPVAVVEPPGPDSSVRELRSPLQLACMRANAILCGAGAFVFHCGSMVLGSLDLNHPGRVPNIWEVGNIEAMLGAVHDVEKLLPEGVETWRVANTGWTPPLPVAPFQPDALWSGGSDHGVNKAYAALGPDSQFAQLLMGVKGYVVMTASADCQAIATDVETGTMVEQTVKMHGDTWRLPGREDTMTAYLITGRFL